MVVLTLSDQLIKYGSIVVIDVDYSNTKTDCFHPVYLISKCHLFVTTFEL